MGYLSRNKQIPILIAVGIIAFVLGVSASSYILLHNVRNVQTVNIGVYWDSGCTNEVSLIDWGVVEPGTTENVAVYILNAGDSNVMLSMNTTNCSPSSASDYITVSWDYEGQSIGPGLVLQTTLTLSTSSSVQGVGSFSFDIVVTGSG